MSPGALKASKSATVLGIILAAAALLRLYKLAGQSLWIDEVLSMRAAQKILSIGAGSQLFNRHGPLYFYLLAPVLAFSQSELVTRLPSVLLGTALVGMVYLLGRDLVDQRTGLVAAAVTAMSPLALWYSQEVRYVGLYLLLAAASAWSAHRFMAGGSLRQGATHVSATLLMLLAFPAGIFVILGENLWVLGLRPGAALFRKWILAQAVVALVFIPWLVLAYEVDLSPFESRGKEDFALHQVSTGFSRPLRPIQIGYPLFTFGAGLTLGPSNRELHEDMSLRPIVRKWGQVASGVLITGVVALVGSLALLKRNPRSGSLLLVLVATSLVGPYVLALFTQIAYNVRYTAGGFPAYLVLLGAGLFWALEKGPWGWGLVAAFASVTIVSLAGNFGDPYYFRDDNRGAARYIAERARPGEPVVVGAEERAFLHYFARSTTSWRRWELRPAGSASSGAEPGTEGRFWVAANRTWEEPGFRKFVEALRGCFPVDESIDLPGYQVIAFRTGEGEPGQCILSFRPAARPAEFAPSEAGTPSR